MTRLEFDFFLLWIISSFLITPAAAVQPDNPPIDQVSSEIGHKVSTLTPRSGYIFSGTVTSIKMLDRRPGKIPIVEISFHVETGIRGVANVSDLTIREWQGATAQGEHYRVGERVLAFFYPPGKLGLTSAVGGPSSRFTLDAQGIVRPVIPPAHPLRAGSGEQKLPLARIIENIRRLEREQ